MLALALALSAANAAEPLGRSLQGEVVHIVDPTLVVLWSLECACGADLAQAAATAPSLVLVNTDAAGQGSQVRHFARSHGLKVPGRP